MMCLLGRTVVTVISFFFLGARPLPANVFDWHRTSGDYAVWEARSAPVSSLGWLCAWPWLLQVPCKPQRKALQRREGETDWACQVRGVGGRGRIAVGW